MKFQEMKSWNIFRILTFIIFKLTLSKLTSNQSFQSFIHSFSDMLKQNKETNSNLISCQRSHCQIYQKSAYYCCSTGHHETILIRYQLILIIILGEYFSLKSSFSITLLSCSFSN